ncbi:hypothetical protein [Paenibacillus wenxiniae]|uniref:Phage tail tape measure protein n=1 Tax=Paenibacillus wenxiniae TaxID=1636843 RepID=A0ABW4RID2_9BACL
MPAFLEAIGIADTLISGIQGQMDRLLNSFKQFLSNVKTVFQTLYEVLRSVSQGQFLKDLIIVNAGGNAKGNKIFEDFRKEALRTGQDVQDYLKGGLSLFSITNEQKNLDELAKYANTLSILSPDGKSMSDASNSIIAAYNGDTSSLASNFGISQGVIDQSDIKEKGSKGDVNGFLNALEQIMNQSAKTEAALNHMIDTPSREWSTLVGNFKSSLSQMGEGALSTLMPSIKKLNDALANGDFAPFIEILSSAFNVVAAVVGVLIESLMYLVTVVQNNWGLIKPILMAIATIFLVTIISQILMIGTVLFALSIPLLLTIAILTSIINYFSVLGITGEDVLGLLIGSFLVFVGTLLNGFIFIYNHFVALYEVLANLFVDPQFALEQFVYSAKVGIIGMLYRITKATEDFAIAFATTINQALASVSEYYNAMVPLINKVKKTNLPTIHVKTDQEIQNTGHDWSNKLKASMDAIEPPVATGNVVRLPRKEYYDTTALMQKGKDIAHNITNMGNGLGSNFFGKDRNYPPPKGKTDTATTNPYFNQSAFPTSIDNVGNVDNLAHVGGTVDISSEDLKMMRDLAEMQAIQHFVTLTPTVQMTTGDINSGADLDTIVGHIGRKLEEEFVSTAQGVYT